MVHPSFLLPAIFFATILSNFDYCDAEIARNNHVDKKFHYLDRFDLDLNNMERKNNPIKWLKRQVRKLKTAFGKKSVRLGTYSAGQLSQDASK